MSKHIVHRNIFGVYEVNWKWKKRARKTALVILIVSILMSIINILSVVGSHMPNKEPDTQLNTVIRNNSTWQREDISRRVCVIATEDSQGNLITLDALINMFSEFSKIQECINQFDPYGPMSTLQKKELSNAVDRVISNSAMNYILLLLGAHEVYLFHEDRPISPQQDSAFILSEHFDSLTQEIPTSYWDSYSEAKSISEAYQIRDRVLYSIGCNNILKFAKTPTALVIQCVILIISLSVIFLILATEKILRMLTSLRIKHANDESA